jgi:hypothetical protein
MVAGCGPASPISNVVVRVFNQMKVDGSFHYDGQGTSGDAPIYACHETDFGLGLGTWQITITDPKTSMTASVTALANAQVYEGYVIHPDGRVEIVYRITSAQTEPPPPSNC